MTIQVLSRGSWVGTITLRVALITAVFALPACDWSADYDAVTDFDVVDVGADAVDDAHGLMTHDVTGLHTGTSGSGEHVEVLEAIQQ